jgi:hypothetical protein
MTPIMRSLWISVTSAAVISIVLGLLFWPPLYDPYLEGNDYVALAHLNYSRVYNYYGGRIVHPLLVRIVSWVTHAPISGETFRWVSFASLLFFFILLGLFYGTRLKGPIWLFLGLGVTALVVDQYRNYYWQDLFDAVVCAAFLFVMRKNKWASLPWLLLLYLTKESAVVLVFVIVVVALMRGQRAYAATSVVIGAVAMVLSSLLVAHAIPNKHGIPVIAVDALKIPYNFCFNLLGLEFWTNTNADTILASPTWIVNLPAWVHLGNIRQFGYCGFDWRRPADLLILFGSGFGALPVLFFRRDLFSRIWRSDLTLTVAALYGLLMWFLTPLVGTGPQRYFLYAWPLFLLFGIVLLSESTSGKRLYAFSAISLAAAWTPALIRFLTGTPLIGPASVSWTDSPRAIIVGLVLVVGEQMLAIRCLNATTDRSAATTEILRVS